MPDIEKRTEKLHSLHGYVNGVNAFWACSWFSPSIRQFYVYFIKAKK